MSACTSSEVVCNVVDEGNGSYELQWRSKLSGVFSVKVFIGATQVSGSPIKIKLTSTIPELNRSRIDGGGLKAGRYDARPREAKGGATAKRGAAAAAHFDALRVVVQRRPVDLAVWRKRCDERGHGAAKARTASVRLSKAFAEA